MKKWSFGIDNENLIDLVLTGKKKATTSLYTGELPIIGEESIICFSDGSYACIVKTIDYKIMKFNEMTEENAKLEGEGNLTLDYWRKAHYDFFKSLDSSFSEESKIIFEIFEVTKKFYNEK